MRHAEGPELKFTGQSAAAAAASAVAAIGAFSFVTEARLGHFSSSFSNRLNCYPQARHFALSIEGQRRQRSGSGSGSAGVERTRQLFAAVCCCCSCLQTVLLFRLFRGLFFDQVVEWGS